MLQEKKKKKQEKLLGKNNVEDEQKSITHSNYKFTASNGVKSMPLFSRVTMLDTLVKVSMPTKTVN